MPPSHTDLLTGYRRNGYYFPVDVMTAEEAGHCLSLLEYAQSEFGSSADFERILRGYTHMVIPFVDDVARSNAVLDPVAQILGPDLLLWSAEFFIKEPRTDDFISWHQDLNYWGLDKANEVTAWIALTPSNVGNGCMRFYPGSHLNASIEHRDTFARNNMLSRGQAIAVDVDEGRAINVELLPGQMSLHHGHTFHASHPNHSTHRRIGMTLRYISPDMRQSSGARTAASLVRGEDHYGHFDLMPPPSGWFNPDDVERCRQALTVMEDILYVGATAPGRRAAQ